MSYRKKEVKFKGNKVLSKVLEPKEKKSLSLVKKKLKLAKKRIWKWMMMRMRVKRCRKTDKDFGGVKRAKNLLDSNPLILIL